jgi:hypothetical protein
MNAQEVYRRKIQQTAELDDSWFGAALVASRAGDDAARRKISGSSLRHVLRVVEGRSGGEHVLESVQDANAAVLEAIRSFTGATVAEFLPHVERCVNDKLDTVRAA